jgi:hypothetical protein
MHARKKHEYKIGGVFLRKLYVKGFLIFFILSLCLSFYRVYQLDNHSLFYDLFHILPILMFNETIDGIFPNYPNVLNIIPIALADGLLGVLTVFCIKLFSTQMLNKKGLFYLITIISFCVTQWIIFQYVPIFQS